MLCPARGRYGGAPGGPETRPELLQGSRASLRGGLWVRTGARSSCMAVPCLGDIDRGVMEKARGRRLWLNIADAQRLQQVAPWRNG